MKTARAHAAAAEVAIAMAAEQGRAGGATIDEKVAITATKMKVNQTAHQVVDRVVILPSMYPFVYATQS